MTPPDPAVGKMRKYAAAPHPFVSSPDSGEGGVLPVVLYNGEPRWTAPQALSDWIEHIPGGLERCRLRYLLLDEGRYREEELPPLRNLVAAVLRQSNRMT